MPKTRKQKNTFLQLLGNFVGFSIMLGLMVWSEFGSPVLGLLTSLGGITLIFALRYAFLSHRKQELLASGVDLVDTMDGETFEDFLMAHFEAQGYKGSLTSTVGDYGADLVLERNGEKLVVQAKRWKQTVGIEAVQQVIGAIKHYQAQNGMVITNSYYSNNARELAKSNNIELWDRDKLIQLMSKSNGWKIAQTVTTKSSVNHVNQEIASTSEEVCPRCGNALVKRNGKRGQFWGCSTFPKCRYTMDLR